jgi:hypothetical protein
MKLAQLKRQASWSGITQFGVSGSSDGRQTGLGIWQALHSTGRMRSNARHNKKCSSCCETVVLDWDMVAAIEVDMAGIFAAARAAICDAIGGARFPL